ncbi:MAG TPA: PASTA domain-containing protein, partial [Gaiella sp.]|nr:PASTA domain-containing protein [Gaiella sp.]
DQDPPGNSTASRGSSVTLSVSKGPKTVTVPDVSLQTVADARATLRAAGFRSTVTQQETSDEALDGLVISQDPAGNAQADPKSTVALTVGSYVPPPDVTTPPPTSQTPTTPATPTTPTPTTPTTTPTSPPPPP